MLVDKPSQDRFVVPVFVIAVRNPPVMPIAAFTTIKALLDGVKAGVALTVLSTVVLRLVRNLIVNGVAPCAMNGISRVVKG